MTSQPNELCIIGFSTTSAFRLLYHSFVLDGSYRMPRLWKCSCSKCLIIGIALVTLLNTFVLFSCRFSDSACPFSSKYHGHTNHLPIPSKEFITDSNSKKDLDDQPTQLQEKNEEKQDENKELNDDKDQINQDQHKKVERDTHKEMVDRAKYKMEESAVNFNSKDYIIAGTKRNHDAFLIIGVPTIYRERASYLTLTLKDLVEGLDESEKEEVLIVVLTADFDPASIISISDQISKDFPNELQTGLIRVIKAPSSFYPPLDKLPRLWGDQPERIRWRSKQCLDYAFLMRYCKELGQYYLQIEDDVTTSKGYLKKIKNFITKHQERRWSILEFGARGFIGMLYRTSDLGHLAAFIKMYYWVYPVDLLFRQYNDFNLHGNPQWPRYMPPLFRHIGTFSSLDGQVRKLEDIKVGRRIYKDNDNPDAAVTTSIRHHVRGTKITSAYDIVRHGMFWGKNVKMGDFVLLEFFQPVRVKKVIVESGGARAPEDYFGAAKILHSKQNGAGECDEFILWKEFNEMPQLKVESSEQKGTLCQCLKIEITGIRRDKKGNPRWLAIREIAVWSGPAQDE